LCEATRRKLNNRMMPTRIAEVLGSRHRQPDDDPGPR
jgi:hypothetical protein